MIASRRQRELALVMAALRGYAVRPAALREPSNRASRPEGLLEPSGPTERELRSAAARLSPPTEILMSFKVRHALQQTAAEWSGDGLESGGFLFGRIRPDCFGKTRVEILEFSPPRRADTRKAGWMRSSLIDIVKALNGELSQWALVGDWHTHLGDKASLEPSSEDIDAWGGRADHVSWKLGRPPGYIGLIVAGTGRSAYGLRLQPWFVPPLRYDILPEDREPKPIAIREVD